MKVEAKSPVTNSTSLLRGAAWSLVSAGFLSTASTVLHYSFRLLLARVLFPEDFGMYAIAVFAVGFLGYLQDFGMDQQLIRSERDELRTILTVKTLIGLCIIGALFAFPSLLGFWSPSTGFIVRVLSLSMLTEGINRTAVSYFQKTLSIGRTVKIETATLCLNGAASFALALAGFGVWSMVIPQIAASVLKAGLYLPRLAPGFRERLDFGRAAQIMKGGRYFFLIGAMGVLLVDVDKAILGHYVSDAVVGQYALAFSLVYLFPRLIEPPVRQVLYPVFCKMTDTPAALRASYESFTVILLALEAPVYAVFLFMPETPVRVVFGGRWLAIAPLVAAMSFLPGVDFFGKLGNLLLQAIRKEAYQFYATVPYLVFFLSIGIYLASKTGASGMIIANYFQLGGLLVAFIIQRALGMTGAFLRDVFLVYAISLGIVASSAWLARGTGLAASLIAAALGVAVSWTVMTALIPAVRSRIRQFFSLLRVDLWRSRTVNT